MRMNSPVCRKARLIAMLIFFASPWVGAQEAAEPMRDTVPPVRGIVLPVENNERLPNLQGMWDLRVSNASNPPTNQIGETEFTYDIVLVSGGSGTEALSNKGFENNVITSSVCVAEGTGNSISTNESQSGAITIRVDVDNGEYYLMSGHLSSSGNEISGTVSNYVGVSRCGANDIGHSFTATRYDTLNGNFTGKISSGTSPAFALTVKLSEQSNFTVSGTVSSTGNRCFASLKVDSSVYPSFVSGNVSEFWGTDSQGDQIVFIGNAGGPNDNPGDEDWLEFFITAIVTSGPCDGQSYTATASFHHSSNNLSPSSSGLLSLPEQIRPQQLSPR